MRNRNWIFLFTFMMMLQHCQKDEKLNTAATRQEDELTTAPPVPDGTYAIRQFNSGRLISLSDKSIDDGVPVQQWIYKNNSSQAWRFTNTGHGFYRISNAYSGKALEAPNGIRKEGLQLWQWRYDGKDAQLWKLVPAQGDLYKIVNKATGLCINLENGGISNGTKITERTSSSSAEQYWQLTAFKSAYIDVDVVNFFRRTNGWIASDGAATALLNDDKVIWLMGDSNIDDYDSVKQKMTCLFQVRNSVLLQPSNHSWDWHLTSTLTGNPFPGIQSYFKNKANDDYWMWPGCGFQVQGNDTVYVYNMPLKKKGAGWANDSNAVWAKIRSSDMQVVAYSMLPYFKNINFGQGFSKESDGYVYAFGSRQTFIYSNVYVARFPVSDPNAPWQFWTKNGWNGDVTLAAPIAEGASNGVAVAKVKNKYLCFSTEFSVGCDQGTEIYVSVSDFVNGPFTERKVIYTIPDKLEGHYPFFYGVNIHPEFDNGNGELLITYDINGYGDCVNTCKNGWADPDTYRPRAVRIPYSLIDPGL